MLSKPKFTLRNSLRRLLPIFGFIVLAGTMGATDAWAKGNALGAGAASLESTPATKPQPRPGQTEMTPPSTGLQPSVGEAYAAREASASGLESFKGGDIVVIGGGGLVLILLIVLIIVLV